VYNQQGALPIELVGRSCCIEGLGLLGIGIPDRGRRDMLGVPTHLRMAVTGARSPRVCVCAGLRTCQHGVSGEGCRSLRTHGAPLGGTSIGHEGGEVGSTWSHLGLQALLAVFLR